MKPRVMILLGSASDFRIAEKAMEIFEELKIPYDLRLHPPTEPMKRSKRL